MCCSMHDQGPDVSNSKGQGQGQEQQTPAVLSARDLLHLARSEFMIVVSRDWV